MDKFEDVKTMAIGGILSIPYSLSLIAPAIKRNYPDSDNWFLGGGFVYTTVLLGSLFNGFGQG